MKKLFFERNLVTNEWEPSAKAIKVFATICIFGIVLLLVVIIFSVVLPVFARSNDLESAVELTGSIQESFFENNGFYKQEAFDDFQFTHIYETPSGEWGYQLFYIVGNTIQSVGYGPESGERTFTRIISSNDKVFPVASGI